jgi:hypothetical protein
MELWTLPFYLVLPAGVWLIYALYKSMSLKDAEETPKSKEAKVESEKVIVKVEKAEVVFSKKNEGK